MKKKLKPETGDRKGRVEQLVKDAEILDGGFWIGGPPTRFAAPAGQERMKWLQNGT